MMNGALSWGALERLASTNNRIKPTEQIGTPLNNVFGPQGCPGAIKMGRMVNG
jgi:hypothetical protein